MKASSVSGLHPPSWTKYVRVVGRNQIPYVREKGTCHEVPQRYLLLNSSARSFEELLSGMSTPAQLTRRYEISSGLLYHWKEQYAKGRFNNEPTKEAALEYRVRQLEQLVGKLTLENEF